MCWIRKAEFEINSKIPILFKVRKYDMAPQHCCARPQVVVALAIQVEKELSDNIYLHFINVTGYLYIVQPRFLHYKPQVFWVTRFWR